MNKSFHKMQGVADLAPLLYRQGVQTVVICPGSRNAPLINSFVSFGKFECISLVDERSAAYFALGVAQQTSNPVAITCTSGTAALNFAPALAEAFYQGLPLIAITADRPAEWIDQADNQAIRQNGIFSNYVKYEATLPVETSHPNDLWSFRRKVSEALNKAVEPKAGPVHLNVPLREPLYDKLPNPDPAAHSINFVLPAYSNIPDIDNFINSWNSYSRKMIVLGISKQNHEFNQIISRFLNPEDTVVIAG